MRKILFFVLAIAALASCGGGRSTGCVECNDSDSVVTDSFATIVGAWLKPAGDTVRGFVLYADNRAVAVNMLSVEMRSWQLVGDSLLIDAAKPVGDSVVAEVVRYRVDTLTADTLRLQEGGIATCYTRKR